MKILSLENITKTFTTDQNEVTVLDKISFDVQEGELTVIVGPSGSGKSTLLRIIAGLIPPTSGSVKWENSDHQLAFVFQSFALFPFLTVFENIEFGLKMNGMEAKKRKEIVEGLI